MNVTRMSAVLGLLLALALAGCGGTQDGDGVATAGNATGTATSSPTAEQLSDEERSAKFGQCMRDNGLPDFQDPDISGGGIKMRMPDGADQEKVKAAQEKCKQYLPNGGERQKPNAEQLEAQRQMAKCMRENGVPNFPDPDADGGIMIQQGSGIDPDSPEFKAAQEKCQKFMPSPGPAQTKGNG